MNMQFPRTACRLALRRVGRRSYHGGEYKPATLNDLPSPCGSWQTQYDAKQRKYNGHLALGVSAIIGTIVFGKAAGLLEFHNDIPERPADIDTYK